VRLICSLHRVDLNKPFSKSPFKESGKARPDSIACDWPSVAFDFLKMLGDGSAVDFGQPEL
jgi:hypothetical protein